MKKSTIALILVLSSLITFSQKIDISLVNMNGNENIFGTSYGYGISYLKKLKKNEIIFQIGQLHYQKEYDDIYESMVYGIARTEM